MLRIPVTFQKMEDIVKFVHKMNQFVCDVDLRCGSYLVDAKSILGALTLQGAQNVEVQIHDENCNDIIECLEEYRYCG